MTVAASAVLVHNTSCNIGDYLASKAPRQVTPGTRTLDGQYVNDLGKVQPWRANYDEYRGLIGRTDYNAGNSTGGIPTTHYHVYAPSTGQEMQSHVPGEFPG